MTWEVVGSKFGHHSRLVLNWAMDIIRSGIVPSPSLCASSQCNLQMDGMTDRLPKHHLTLALRIRHDQLGKFSVALGGPKTNVEI